MKYTVTLSKLKFLESFKTSVLNRFLQQYNLQELEKNDSWWNNFLLNNDEIQATYPLSQYLNDRVMVLTVFNSSKIKIHADGIKNNAAIQIPIYGCTTKTVTHFYEYNDGTPPEFKWHPKIGAREVLYKEKLVVSHSFSVTDTPILFRSNWPHSVTNNYNKTRVMFSWRFKPEYSWDDAVEICHSLKLLY